jgi:hypothetical protein
MAALQHPETVRGLFLEIVAAVSQFQASHRSSSTYLPHAVCWIVPRVATNGQGPGGITVRHFVEMPLNTRAALVLNR